MNRFVTSGAVICVAVMLASASVAGSFKVLHYFDNNGRDGTNPAEATSQGRAFIRGFKEIVLYDFTGGDDGAYPEAALTFDAAGNLYGTTLGNQGVNGGTVFRLSAAGKLKALYTFCSQRDCADGAGPVSRLLMDGGGNLYGTTSAGGSSGDGTVFKLTPKGHETVIHAFTGGNDDGAIPTAGVVMDKNGDLYGTTSEGGRKNDGTVFRLTPKGHETVIHAFTGGGDGANPAADLLMDKFGNLYGTTTIGGYISKGNPYGYGVVFEMTPVGHEDVLYAFTTDDSHFPFAGLIMDKSGNLYGTATQGGVFSAGTVFEISNRAEQRLYSFTGGNSGSGPTATLLRDRHGNLFGTTPAGGLHNDGVVFRLKPDLHETVLNAFDQGRSGSGPVAGLIEDARGDLYGTAPFGGTYGYGVVFKIKRQ